MWIYHESLDLDAQLKVILVENEALEDSVSD